MIQEVLETTLEITEKGQLTNARFTAFQISNELPFSPEPDVVIQEEDDEEELEEIEEYEEWDDDDEWEDDDDEWEDDDDGWDDEDWEDEEVDWDEEEWIED